MCWYGKFYHMKNLLIRKDEVQRANYELAVVAHNDIHTLHHFMNVISEGRLWEENLRLTNYFVWLPVSIFCICDWISGNIPNCTSGKIKLTLSADSYTTTLLIYRCSRLVLTDIYSGWCGTLKWWCLLLNWCISCVNPCACLFPSKL